MKYLKVMFKNKGANYEYKIDEINVANNWNPTATKGKDFGGFNFSTEDKIIRWIHRGDTLYDVIIPDDTKVIDCVESATPHGVFRSNKIIVTNPRPITDEMATYFYEKSTIPTKAYYKTLSAVSVMNYKNTALKILRDRVNKDNINDFINEWNDFIGYGGDGNRKESNETVKLINEYLLEIQSDLLISINVNKDPYIKTITNDNIINITGESGSGKSFYTKDFLTNDKYIVIDTDELDDKKTNNKNCIEFRNYLKSKYGNNKIFKCEEFNILYKEILDYYKNTTKTLVIDSAQFRNLHDEDLKYIKGRMVIIRTCIDKCYERCLTRWKKNNLVHNEEDFIKYKNKKIKMYLWYKSLNEFIQKIYKI